jgi:hypothetical protein
MKLNQTRIGVEQELVLCCSRTHTDPKTVERVTRLLEQEVDWDYLLRLAFMHGVAPLFYSNFRKCWPDAIPKSISQQFQRLLQLNVQRNLFLTAELLKLLKTFETHGLQAVPFKGPVLAASAYGDVTLRQFGDLDIWVHKENVFEAGRLLVACGYQSSSIDSDAQREDNDIEQVAFREPKFYVFRRQDGRGKVDLQWRITEQYFSFSLDKNRLWERLALVSIAGKTVRTFAPTDMLLILCVHGSKHRWEALKWVCDVAELVRAQQSEIDWGEVQKEASRQRVQRMLRLGLFLAHDLLGASLAEDVVRQFEPDRKIKALGRQIRERLFAPINNRPGHVKRIMFYFRTKDRWHETAPFCLRYVFQCLQAIVNPTAKERAILPLPSALFFLYYFFRPLRLMAKYCWLAAIRICSWSIRGAGNLSRQS